MRGLVYGILIVRGFLAGICMAAPKPAIVPGPGIWTVNTTFTHPQQIVLPSGVDNRLMRFWYVLLTVTNKTGQDVDFYPKCDLMTDTFQIIPAGKGVPLLVFEQINRRHQSRYPFLESVERVGNKLLQGEDNTKDIAIIWHDFDTKARNIKIFIAGLSNETVAIDHPVARDKETGKPIKAYLRKTLELSYALEGDPQLRSDIKVAYKGKRWIMR